MADETKVCKYCQTEIPKKAKICPNCKKKQGPKVGLIIAIVLVVLLIIGVAGGGNDSKKEASTDTQQTATTSTSESTETTEDAEPVEIEYTAVTAKELEDAIHDNALKATDTYKDKYIEVTGYLGTIDASGKYIGINSEDEWSFVNIQCYIKNDDQKAVVMDMSKGQALTVKGKVKDVGEVLGYSIDIDEIIAN